METQQPTRPENPVDSLNRFFQNKRLSAFGIKANITAIRFREQAHFSLHLVQGRPGKLSLDPVFSGLFSAGRPSQNIFGWVDGDYFDIGRFDDGSQISLARSACDFELFRILGELVPAGGSFMVSYSLFSKESDIHRDTKRGLDRGYPPATTPLGFLLFSAGCGMGFKDWYFAEGGREGPEKLQGFKPVDSETAKKKAIEMFQELRRFKSASAPDDLARDCKIRAESVIQELEKLTNQS